LYYIQGNYKRKIRAWGNKLSQYYMKESAVTSALEAARLTKSTS
jgi:hypothetical protein